jgi:hypothetical protein
LERGLLHFALGIHHSAFEKRDAKAELNRRGQACEVLADTGIRVARD